MNATATKEFLAAEDELAALEKRLSAAQATVKGLQKAVEVQRRKMGVAFAVAFGTAPQASRPAKPARLK